MKFSEWTTRTGNLVSVPADACDHLLADASASPRKRAHQLLHESHADQVQRLMVAFTEGTYMQPHRHPEQWEMIMPIRGKLALLTFSDPGEITERAELTPETVPVLQIPAGIWHTLIAITPKALMLEMKPGPFRPCEFLDVFPSEN